MRKKPKEGDPVTLPLSGDVIYFRTRREAARIESLFNEGKPAVVITDKGKEVWVKL